MRYSKSNREPPIKEDSRPGPLLDHLSPGVVVLWAWTVSEMNRIIRNQNEDLLEKHEQMKCLMSVEEVADVLGVSKRTTEDLIASGELDPIWVKGQRRFHPDTVDAYMRRQVRGADL